MRKTKLHKTEQSNSYFSEFAIPALMENGAE